MDFTHRFNSPLGGITLASDGEALTGLWFDGQKYFAASLEKEHEERMLPVFDLADKWLNLYFSGSEPGFLPPLLMRTTEFRKNNDLWGNRRQNCRRKRAFPDVSTGRRRSGCP